VFKSTKVGLLGLNTCGSGYREVVSFCEDGNELSSLKQGVDFTQQ
jgi:hypothetical protein